MTLTRAQTIRLNQIKKGAKIAPASTGFELIAVKADGTTALVAYTSNTNPGHLHSNTWNNRALEEFVAGPASAQMTFCKTDDASRNEARIMDGETLVAVIKFGRTAPEAISGGEFAPLA